PPDGRDVDGALRDRLDQPGRRVLFAIIAVDEVAGYIIDDAEPAERVHGRRIRTVIAGQMHANRERLEPRIEDRRHRRLEPGRLHEDVRRAVIRTRRRDELVLRRHADHEIALAGVQCIANKTSPLRPPRVDHADTELARDQLRDPVLEALLGFVRERQVVRIGADSEPRFRFAISAREPDRGKRPDERRADAAAHAIAHRRLPDRSGPRLPGLPARSGPRRPPARRLGAPGRDGPGLHRPATLARRLPPAAPETRRPAPPARAARPPVLAARPRRRRARAARTRTRSRPGPSRPAGPASRRRSRARRTARPYRVRRRRPRPTSRRRPTRSRRTAGRPAPCT